MATKLLIDDSDIRMDKETGFVCITDIGNAKATGGGKDFVKNWLRNANTIEFIIAWERKHNFDFKGVEFDPFRKAAGLNSFRVSAGELIDAGATGMITKRGRYGGTYCTIDWTIHFANWLDPHFYVETIDAFRRMTDQLHGRDSLYRSFSRELVAENYQLITQANDKRKIPRLPHPMTSTKKAGDGKTPVKRHLNQVDADIINLAVWRTTAKDWRTKFPDHAKGGKNLRDYASDLELKILNTLQVHMRHLQEDQYTAEEKLDRLTNKAKELIGTYAGKPAVARQHLQHLADRPW